MRTLIVALAASAKGTQALMRLGRPIALAFGVGLATLGAAHAIVIVPPATFYATLEVFGYGGGGSTPGDYSIDNYCDAFGCGSASAVMTSNVAGEQTTSGSALSSRDVGANSGIDIVYYFYFPGPTGGTVDYHWSASGATSIFGAGSAFAHLYKNGLSDGTACSSSLVGGCGAIGDSFSFDSEFSAPANTLQMVEIQLSGSTQGFGGGPYTHGASHHAGAGGAGHHGLSAALRQRPGAGKCRARRHQHAQANSHTTLQHDGASSSQPRLDRCQF